MAEGSIELGYYSAVLRRHRLLIGVAATLGAVGTALFFGGTRYESTAEVVIAPIASAGAIDADRLVSTETEQRIAESVVVAQIAADHLGNQDVNQLRRDLIVEVPLDSRVLVFRFGADDPATAQAGAQAFAESYLQFRGEDALRERDQRIDDIEARIESLQQQLASAQAVINASNEGGDDAPSAADVAEAQTQRDLILSELNSLNDSRVDEQNRRVNPGNVTSPARDATASSISTPVLLVLGALGGAMVGAVIAFVRERLQGRVHAPGELEADLGAPVLASIPVVSRSSQLLVTRTEPHAPAAHAYRRLAVTLLSTSEQPLRSVVIVAATSQEPRATVAINLSIALIQQGRRVLLVSGDRHDPKIDRAFDLVNHPGLDEHLTGRGTPEPEEVLHGLHVLPSGSGVAFPVDNVPPAVAINRIIERGSRIADVVLIDVPAMLDYPDAEVIGPLVDAVVVVAGAERTRRDDLVRLRSRMRLVGGHIAGSALVQRQTLSHHLGVMMKERSEARQYTTPESRRVRSKPSAPASEAEPVAAVAEDDSTDSAALRARIDALLQRHSTAGSRPHVDDEAGENGNGSSVDAPEGVPGKLR